MRIPRRNWLTLVLALSVLIGTSQPTVTARADDELTWEQCQEWAEAGLSVPLECLTLRPPDEDPEPVDEPEPPDPVDEPEPPDPVDEPEPVDEPDEPSEPANTGDSEGTDSSSDGVKLDIAELFFGEGKFTYEGLSQFMNCPKANPADPFYDPSTWAGFVGARCGGAVEAQQITTRIVDRARERIPEPTPRQKALIGTWGTAHGLANLEAKDGTPLFPTVIAAMPVIEKLINDYTYTPTGQSQAERFLKMLMALDANQFEERFGQEGSS